MSDRPKRAKAPLTLISTTLNPATDKIIQVQLMFEDADGHRWATTHIPTFIFDLEYIGHKDD